MADESSSPEEMWFGMNNSVAAKRVFALSLAFVFIYAIADAKAQILDRALSLQDVSLQLQTPEAIARFMWQNFRFEDDRSAGDEWQTAEKFLATQRGDCEDFALFAHTVLKLNGVKSYLLNIYGKRYAHTICFFKNGDEYIVIDGHQVHHFAAEDFKKLISKIYPYWREAALVQPVEEDGQAKPVVLAEFEQQIKRSWFLRIFA